MPPGPETAPPLPPPGGAGDSDATMAQERPARSASTQQHQRFQQLAALAIATLVGASLFYLWHDRQQSLDEARLQITRSTLRLSQELAQTLSLAKVSIDQAERRLALLPVGWLRNIAPGDAVERAALVAVLGLPFELSAITVDGHSVALIDSPASADRQVWLAPPADVTPGLWHLAQAGRTDSTHFVSLFWPAAPNLHGVSGYRVDLPSAELNRRLVSDRFSAGSRVAVWHWDNTLGATLLAGAGEGGQSVADAQPTLLQAWSRSDQGLVDLHNGDTTEPNVMAFHKLPGNAHALIVTHEVSRDVLLAPWAAKLPWTIGLVLLLSAGMGYGGWRLDRSLQALSRSELRFRLAAASGQVWEWDIVNREAHYPITFWEKLGLPAPSAAEALRHFESLLQPTDLAAIRSATRHHLLNREPCVVEFQIKDATGRVHWFETRGQAVWDKHGYATYMAGTMFEITERRELQDAQRQALQKLTSVTHASAAMFWTMDANRHSDWFNQRWLDFTGRTLAQECGRGWIEGLHPDDVDECLASVDKAMEAHQPFAVEYRLRRHDGQFRWILDQGRPQFDADGTFAGYVGSCVDLTDLKQARAAAEEQRSLLNRVFDVLPDLFFLVAPDGTILDHKSRAGDQWFVPPKQFLGKRLHAVLPPHIGQAFDAELSRLQTDQLGRFEYVLPEIDGPTRYFEARLARLPAADQVIAVIRDITEAKQAEAERERLNRFVVLLFGLASRFINLQPPQLNAEINKALGEMGEFVNADRAYLFALDFQAQTGSNTHEWCAPGIEPQIDQLQALPISRIPEWVEAHLRGDIVHIADVALLPQGSLRATLEPQGIRSLLTLPLTGSDGTCLGFVGFDSVKAQHVYDTEELGLLRLFAQMMVNVHERQATEAEVRRLQDELEQRVLERTQQLDASVRQLQQVNRELEAFTYSVSHDLKAPLRGIDGYCLLLREDHADALNPEAMAFLQKIHKATQHMAALINDLLAYSRLERQAQHVADLDLGHLVQEVVEGLGNEIQLSGLQLDVELPEACRVHADRLGLGMVLRNLLDNAIKFSRHSPSPHIRIEAQCDAGETILSVQDNGLGFDMKYHDRIFTLFQRLQTNDLYPGTGIGLAMVHKAIDRMGGRIWAHSTPGEGATFYIALPEAQQSWKPPTNASPVAG